LEGVVDADGDIETLVLLEALGLDDEAVGARVVIGVVVVAALVGFG